MRYLLSLCAVLIACHVSRAQDAQDVNPLKAKASLALAKAARERESDAHAQAAKAAAEALKQCKLERSEREGCMTDLSAAQSKADVEKRVLFVWIGMTCDTTIRKAFPSAVHVHVATMNGSAEARLVVAKSKTETWRLWPAMLGPNGIAPIKSWIEMQPQKQSSAAPTLHLTRTC